MGVPVIGCDCPVCTSGDPRNRRLRTSVLLSCDNQQVLIDAGPDFREQALHAELKHLAGVLITHSHFDHTAGLDDLRPLSLSGNSIPIYGSSATLADIRRRFYYAFDETSVGSTRPSLDLQSFHGPFECAGLPIEPLEVFHGTWPINAFRIGRLGYITDASRIPAESLARLTDLDVLVLNALRIEPHPTHFSLDQALEIVAELRPKQAFFVHMTHQIDHSTIGARLPSGVALAYDGLEVMIALESTEAATG